MRSNQAKKRFLPKISVIVPIYNGEADLPGLLNCLKAQTYPSHLVNYCLVDNGSHDRTSEMLNASQDAQNFMVLSESQIQSSYAARNVGIRSTTGEILVFTDADCRPEPDWLEHLIQPFEDSAVGLVAGEVKALLGNTLLEQYADRQETLSQKHTLAHPFCAYGQTANLAVRYQVVVSSLFDDRRRRRFLLARSTPNALANAVCRMGDRAASSPLYAGRASQSMAQIWAIASLSS